MASKKLQLVFDRMSMPTGIVFESVEELATAEPRVGVKVERGPALSYKKPKAGLADLVELRNLPLINIAEVANSGGKGLSPQVKTYINEGYQFYQADLGVNLGPSTEYKFLRAQLAYKLISVEASYLRIFDIFPQTTYEDKLKINGSVGIDASMKYKISDDAKATIKFAIEPATWVWKIATIESTGQGTSKARWLFTVNKNVASLQTSMVIMTKTKPPISLTIGGWVEINPPGIFRATCYYKIKSDKIQLK
jgi:hypothetical protein